MIKEYAFLNAGGALNYKKINGFNSKKIKFLIEKQ